MNYPEAIDVNDITAETLDEWTRGCLEFYWWNDISPNDKSYSNQWDDAHHPHPVGESTGNRTVRLAYHHHQIHGLLQSNVEKRRCFWTGRAKAFLRSEEAQELPDYFLETLWRLYWKWVGVTRRVLKHPKKIKPTGRRRRKHSTVAKGKRIRRPIAKWADRIEITKDRSRLVNFRLDCEILHQLDEETAAECFEQTINSLWMLVSEDLSPEEQSVVERQVLGRPHALVLTWIDRFSRRARVKRLFESLEQQRDITADPAVETTAA